MYIDKSTTNPKGEAIHEQAKRSEVDDTACLYRLVFRSKCNLYIGYYHYLKPWTEQASCSVAFRTQAPLFPPCGGFFGFSIFLYILFKANVLKRWCFKASSLVLLHLWGTATSLSS
ncbi:hypothetical protein ACQKD9_25725 [Bacillus paramycoides]|uniref:hypothetical protein n=1 Tax=Bacillus paramycoides TaxID=2026194 RepID=UPI003CFF1199